MILTVMARNPGRDYPVNRISVLRSGKDKKKRNREAMTIQPLGDGRPFGRPGGIESLFLTRTNNSARFIF